jgi:long-chain acyl-CoA synthetase
MNEGHYKIERIDAETLSTVDKYTFPQILYRQAEKLGSSNIAIREKAFGIWQTYNWEEYLSYTKRAALGLLSLGLKRGENVGLILDNHPEWLFAELGVQAVGGITIPFFTSAVAKELGSGLARVEAAYVFAQDQEQVDKLLEIRDNLSYVRRLIYIDPTGMRNYRNDPWLISFSDLLD